MGSVNLLPELRTSGGEALSLYREGDWIGDMYLIYRENDLLTGSIHIDHLFVDAEDVNNVIEELRGYIRSLSYALNVADSHVNIIYGSYSLLDDFDEAADKDLEDMDVEDVEEIKGYERWIVGVGKRGIEYQIYNEAKELVAEAIVDIKGTRIIGDIHFTHEPSEEEMEDIEAILLKDYDLDLIDQYNFTYTVNGQEYEEVEMDSQYGEDVDEEEEEAIDPKAGDDEWIQMLSRQEDEDDYEERERAEVVFDLVDRKNEDLGQATFLYSEDGVDVSIDLQIKPNEDTAHHVMRTVFKEALTDPMEWVNIRMYHKGEVVDGFHFERGGSLQRR